MTIVDPLSEAMKSVNTTYTVRVGCFTHKVDRRTGRHEVVAKEALVPQTFYRDAGGCLHVAKETK